MNYLCVTADVIDSRNPASEKYLSQIQQKLLELNQELSPVVPLGLSAGDEIQGLWGADANLPQIQVLLHAFLAPLQLRIGFGLGSISTGVQATTREMRGEAFILARQALEMAQKTRGKICFNSLDPKASNTNITLELLAVLLAKWNEQTYRRFLLYKELGNIQSVAKLEQVSPEAINKFINRHHVRTVLKAIEDYAA